MRTPAAHKDALFGVACVFVRCAAFSFCFGTIVLKSKNNALDAKFIVKICTCGSFLVTLHANFIINI